MGCPGNFSQFLLLLLLGNTVFVEANFIMTIKFIDYANPSGLCAECNNTLEAGLSSIVPVCCNLKSSLTETCGRVGEIICKTRFRWTLRGFGESLETRPVKNGSFAVYSYNPCGHAYAMCPFPEPSRTFKEGDIAFLGRSNPDFLSSPAPWTGQIQFFVEAVHKVLPNIIDSFLINLDSLDLGSDFTKEMTFTGYHNISQMTMTFKVDCVTNYHGPECTFFCEDSPGVWVCDETRRVCVHDGYDSEENCSQCLPNRDLFSNCSSCVSGFVGNDCSPGSDMSSVIGGAVGGLVGGVVVLVLVILLLILILTATIKMKKRNTNASKESVEPESHIPCEDNPLYGISGNNTASHIQCKDNPVYIWNQGTASVPPMATSMPL